MEVNVVTSIISSVGFPIFCCIGMGYYINSTMKEFTKTMQSNTLALEKLIAKITDKNEGE